ncbi:hypothetical protein ABBQ38_006131 [Trebouxia sp. C0009 RCD-2024]
MQQRLITPKTALVYRCNRFPWNVSRALGRYVFGRADHRDATVMTQAEPAVLSDVSNGIATVTLNRPKALNSLNQDMVDILLGLYRNWQSSNDVHAVIVKGAGGKAFCAGGDVKATVQQIMAGQRDEAPSFFTHEYTMNNVIAKYPKPYISLLDGIVMGGGAGVSIHGSFRVATEKSMFAMPECGIGLFTDIGSAYFLSRLPGELGMYLALTGQRLKGIQVKEATLATHYLPSHRLPELEQALHDLGPQAAHHSSVHTLLCSLEEKDTAPQQSDLLLRLPEMSACFNKDSVEDVYAALQELGTDWSQATLKLLHGGSPTSQKIVFKHVKAARNMSLAKVLETDFRLLHHMCHISHDFVEGIRAKLIEKDNNARWKPATVHEVSESAVNAYFKPLHASQELHLEETVQHLQSRL